MKVSSPPAVRINPEALRVADPECVVLHPGPMNREIEIDSRTIAESSKGWDSEEIADARYVNMEGLVPESENTIQIAGNVPDILMRDMKEHNRLLTLCEDGYRFSLSWRW